MAFTSAPPVAARPQVRLRRCAQSTTALRRRRIPSRSVQRASATPPSRTETSDEPQYSLRARLKEETEAPFRKVRMFVWAGCAASAGVGGVIALSRVGASLAGISGVQPLGETIPNVAIDFAVVALSAALLRFELRAGQRRLERIGRGARLAALRAQDSSGGAIRTLSTLRGKRRIAVVAGKTSAVLPAIYDAHQQRAALDAADLSVIPVFADLDAIEQRRLELPPGGSYLLQATDTASWRKWYDVEREAMRRYFSDAVDECFVVIVRLDGKVGARGGGAPDFTKLVEEIGRLPSADQYGRP